MKFINIVPRLPPAIDGVGDYVLAITESVESQANLEPHFLVCDPKWKPDSSTNSSRISQISLRNKQSLCEALQNLNHNIVILHYVGYGYAKWGCPNWLFEGLKKWKGENPRNKVITMFHEIYAERSKPWKHNFWLSETQKKLAKKLIDISNFYMTNSDAHATKIAILAKKDTLKIPVLPVISNIGEISQPVPTEYRTPRLIVFGQANTRNRAYTNSVDTLSQICDQIAIEEIADIGPPIPLPKSIANIPIRQFGLLESSEISKIMSRSLAGFVNYDINRLAKSGVFAAYCAHGLLPITQSSNNSSIDGLESAKHYWTPSHTNSQDLSTEMIGDIAKNAFKWYTEHNVKSQAKIYIDSLKSCTQ